MNIEPKNKVKFAPIAILYKDLFDQLKEELKLFCKKYNWTIDDIDKFDLNIDFPMLNKKNNLPLGQSTRAGIEKKILLFIDLIYEDMKELHRAYKKFQEKSALNHPEVNKFQKTIQAEFKHSERIEELYICSEGKHNCSHGLEAIMIFFETPLKIILRLLTFFQCIMFLYFAHNEKNSYIYKDDEIKAQEINDSAIIHNAGHAYQLIQTNGFNVITDPVFASLNPVLYPEKTRIGKGFDNSEALNKLKIDAIIISHNHRDHVCKKSLKILANLKPQPIIIVPRGDMKLFKNFCFKNVKELRWYEQIKLVRKENNEEKKLVLLLCLLIIGQVEELVMLNMQ